MGTHIIDRFFDQSRRNLEETSMQSELVWIAVMVENKSSDGNQVFLALLDRHRAICNNVTGIDREFHTC